MSDLLQPLADSSWLGNQSVFTGLDFHSSKLTTDHKVEIFRLDREKVRSAVGALRTLVKSLIEAEFGVKDPMATFPLVLSQIRPGETERDYRRAHVDFYSYQETLIHFTAVLYLNSPGLTGGKFNKVSGTDFINYIC